MKHCAYSEWKGWRLSCNHGQLAASELILEQPVAQVNCQVNLIWFTNLKQALVLLHENGDEFVADFWSVLCRIDKAELLSARHLCYLRMLLQINLLRFYSLLPADLVKALAEVNHEGHNSAVEG